MSLLATRYTVLQSAMSGAERIFKLEGKVESTKRWDTFRIMPIGQIELQAGVHLQGQRLTQ